MASPAPRAAAEEAGLRYVTGNGPCIRRTRHGRHFRYLGTNGQPLHNAKDLDRIRSLVIPPAWEDVWICPSANGHLQAVGRDARGRKQYRYHPRYRAHRDEAKFSRMIAFGTVLALMRRRVDRDLRRHGLPREKVLAAVVKLLETTYIRVGNDEYARDNESFGLTTMKNRHVHIAGRAVTVRVSREERPEAPGCAHGPAPRAHRQAMPRPAGLRAIPICGCERRDAPHRFGRRESIYPAAHRARLHGEGFPYLGRHAAGRARTRRRGAFDQRDSVEAGDCISREDRCAPVGEPAGYLPEILCASGDSRCVRGWIAVRDDGAGAGSSKLLTKGAD